MLPAFPVDIPRDQNTAVNRKRGEIALLSRPVRPASSDRRARIYVVTTVPLLSDMSTPRAASSHLARLLDQVDIEFSQLRFRHYAIHPATNLVVLCQHLIDIGQLSF